MNFLKNKKVIITVILLSIIITTFVIIIKTKDTSLNKISKDDITKFSLDITGATDTSTAFQKMVDSYPSGSIIKLPKGLYNLKNTVKMKDGIKLIGEKGVILTGNGKNTLFTLGNKDSFKGIEFQNCSTALSVTDKKALTITDCKFTKNISYAAINLSTAADISITNSTFYAIRKYGVLIDNDSTNIFIDKNNFDNPKVFGGYDKEQISGHIYSLSGSNIKVTNNIIKNSGGQGVIFGFNSTTGKGTKNSLASKNYCEGNGQEGLTVYGGDKKVSSGNSIISNTSKNNRFNQIEIWQSNNNIVKNNIVEESLKGIGNLGAICLYDTWSTTCTGNKISSAQNNGIDITAGSSYCTVTGNTIGNTNGKKDKDKNEMGNGILLDTNGKSDPHHITIKNNKIQSRSGIIDKSGIYSTSNKNQYNKIETNTITGYKTALHEYAKLTIGK